MLEHVNNWSERELAYSAGVVDSGGSIYLRMRPNGGTLELRLSVVNTNPLMMDWLMVHSGGARTTTCPKNQAHKPLHHWRVTYNAAVPVLEALSPYLVLKRPQADLAIEAWERREPIPRVGGKRVEGTPDNVIEMRRGYVDQMHDLNRKGVA